MIPLKDDYHVTLCPPSALPLCLRPPPLCAEIYRDFVYPSRRGIERLVKKAKADRQEGTATAAPGTEAEPSVAAARGKGAENPKKKKKGGNNVKQD